MASLPCLPLLPCGGPGQFDMFAKHFIFCHVGLFAISAVCGSGICVMQWVAVASLPCLPLLLFGGPGQFDMFAKLFSF